MRLASAILFAICALSIGCPGRAHEGATRDTTRTRTIAGYPWSIEAGTSVAACQDFETALPKPLPDDEVLDRFVGLSATHRSRACVSLDYHPCDPVGPHDCDSPGWDKTWTAPVRRKEISIFQRYWTLLDGKCRFIGEVRFPEPACGGELPSTIEQIESAEVPPTVDLINGEPIRERPQTAVGSANHWRP